MVLAMEQRGSSAEFASDRSLLMGPPMSNCGEPSWIRGSLASRLSWLSRIMRYLLRPRDCFKRLDTVVQGAKARVRGGENAADLFVVLVAPHFIDVTRITNMWAHRDDELAIQLLTLAVSHKLKKCMSPRSMSGDVGLYFGP